MNGFGRSEALRLEGTEEAVELAPLRCAAIAGAAGLPLSSHLYPEVSAHLLRVSESADWLEWRDWAHPFLAEPFEVKDGTVIVPDRPGNGIEWDERAVKRLLKA